MNLHILGAGSMGCLWAAHLELSSKQLLRTSSNPRPLNISFISTRTNTDEFIDFKLESSFLKSNHSSSKKFNFPISTPDTLRNPIDCLLVCAKSFDALPGLVSIGNHLSPSTQIVLFQNGLGSQFEIIKEFPNNPIFAAVTTEGANRPDRNLVIHAGKGKTHIGALNIQGHCQGAKSKLETYLNLPDLASLLSTEFTLDIWQALWQKLVINCAINPFTAILNCSNGRVAESHLFKDKWPKLKAELLAMLERAGYPSDEEKIDKIVLEVMQNTSSNISSMLQDIRLAKTTEIEHICGFAYRYLEEKNINAPTLKYLYNEVQRKSIK